jgi:hypothetical protein
MISCVIRIQDMLFPRLTYIKLGAGAEILSRFRAATLPVTLFWVFFLAITDKDLICLMLGPVASIGKI